jgi:UDP-N-acetylmuramate dehydrogenase
MNNLKNKNKKLYTKDNNHISKNGFSKTKFFNFSIITKLIIIFIFLIIYFITNVKMNISNIHLPLSQKSLIINEISSDFIKCLKIILKEDELIENEMMQKHTTFRTGGPAKFFVKPKTDKQIIEIIKLCNKYKVNYFVLGNGSNLLVSDNGYYGIVIQIHEHNFANLEVLKEDENIYYLKVGGGILMKTLSIEACLLSLSGLEDIIDIPGTIGGGIIMNASFKGSGIREVLEKVKIITPEGIIMELKKKECELTHRGSLLKDKRYLVIEALFKLKKWDKMIIQKTMTDNTKMRYEKQPMYFGSAGCFFVWNHVKLGSMYEKYKENNLVGYRVGNAMIYTYNIAFIVNLGNSNSNEIMEIVTHIEKIIEEKYAIKMKREVIVIGIFNETNYY